MAESEGPLLVTDPPELADELLKFIVNYCSAEKLLRDHAVDAHGVCKSCHWRGPCTLYKAATVVVATMGGSKFDRHQKAMMRILAKIEQIEERDKVGRCAQVRLPHRSQRDPGRPYPTVRLA